MNNYILINRTYAETTPESVVDGDFSETGMIEENVAVSFSKLVELMIEHSDASCYPNHYDTNVWYTTHPFVKNWAKGIGREESIHFCIENTPNAAKYWKWARILADLKIKK